MSAVKTYQLKFRAISQSGKSVKIYGIISGMCEQHAMEQGTKIANDFALKSDDKVIVKLVEMKKLNCDFMVVPGDKENEPSVEGFIEHLKNKYQIKDTMEEKQVKPSLRGFLEFMKVMIEAKQDYEDGAAKAREVNAEAKAAREASERDTTVNS